MVLVLVKPKAGIPIYGSDEMWPSTSLDAWQRDPMRAFSDWLARTAIQGLPSSRQFRATSAKTYTAMFHLWVEYLRTQEMTVLEAVGKDVTAFFNMTQQFKLDPVSRRRYLQLLSRVHDSFVAKKWCKTNPIECELAKEEVLDLRFPPGLTLLAQAQLVEHLTPLEDWKSRRDKAMIALILGAGLRNNEALTLRLGELREDYSILVKPRGVHRPHRTLVMPEGPWRTWLQDWVEIRLKMEIPGDILCPSTLRGNTYSPSGLFRRLITVFNDAKIVSDKCGANVLRNTFALNALACERYEIEDVQEFLGHEELRATGRHMARPREKTLYIEHTI